ncbi:PepSY-associated TM helix domain-containing protein [Novosphingobium sp. BL-8H]|uniref:PepSY-associated TM helix domain-containing protein n=1 Tax=Novosphingobium sp. BL-8H TaxID=3127640 RepID=UPI00375649CC
MQHRALRQAMARLHIWVGLLPGWLLFVIFLFGTVSFIQQEISCWMKPELVSGEVSDKGLDAAASLLSARAADAGQWQVALPSARGGDPITVAWMPREGARGGSNGEVTLDPASGREITIRETLGGWFLYRFHFELHYAPVFWTRMIVSLAALAMLVGILSGILTHKKIFADFFLLRFGKGQRSWLDAHNVTAVLALPFHLMITYTGLATLLFTLMPWAISANFTDRDAFNEAASPQVGQVTAGTLPAPDVPLRVLVRRAESIWHGPSVRHLTVSDPGTRDARVELSPFRDRLGSVRSALVFRVAGGELLSPLPSRGPAVATHAMMIDLHTGLFAGWMLRWLYILSGIGGTVMVASSLVLWTVKRRAKLPDPALPYFGLRLVERLNIGVIAGAPAGIAVYFLANRVLPIAMTNRADWEINSLFIAWGGVFVWTLARPVKQAWMEALAACAALYALVPLVNALTTARGLIPSLIARDWVFVCFDGVMLAMAAACAFMAWKVATHKPKAGPRRKARMAMEAAP